MFEQKLQECYECGKYIYSEGHTDGLLLLVSLVFLSLGYFIGRNRK